MRSPVTAVIQSFNALTEDEKKLCLDFIAPEPEPEPPARQTRKKRTTKSAKAQSLSSAIKTSHEAKVDSSRTGDVRCIATIPGLGVECGDPEDNKVHDKNAGYAGYHPFEPPAQTAEKKSKRKAAAASATQNTEIEKAAAIGASGD